MGRSTEAVRCRVPPPQTTVQDDHSDQPPSLQSWSQEPVLQSRASCTLSHSSPPLPGLVRIERVLDWRPLPHSLVHCVQPDQSDITQSAAHLTWLHFFIVSRTGHCTPYSFGLTTFSLFSVWVPPQAIGSFWGQVSSQSLSHGPATNSPTSQSVTALGGEALLAVRIPFRTFLTAHMSVKRISSTLALQSFVFHLYTLSRCLYCSLFSLLSMVSALRADTVSASICMSPVLMFLLVESCSFMLAFSAVKSSLSF
mmetsp:Transcript_65589/g.211584  ORF Transcript_65589/g.211584 Transcript_65589/m.211584 type:complete len:254 (+) Transcript_65589:1101-1862(+)